MKVLVTADDHGYREVQVKTRQVVYNPRYQSYTEYAGDEYLEPGELVVERLVAE